MKGIVVLILKLKAEKENLGHIENAQSIKDFPFSL